MLKIAAGLFAIAALGGVTMAVMHFRGKTPPPVALAVGHGAFAASGIVVLALAAWSSFSGGAAAALALFVLAALGGFTLALGFHWRGKPLPSGFIVGHGGLAVLAFLILLAVAFNLVR
jgi:hypothetical protein